LLQINKEAGIPASSDHGVPDLKGSRVDIAVAVPVRSADKRRDARLNSLTASFAPDRPPDTVSAADGVRLEQTNAIANVGLS
jgi:hypothetical protein